MTTKVIASTLAEIQGLLASTTITGLTEVTYGVPAAPGQLPRLVELALAAQACDVRLSLFIDSNIHVDMLENYARVHAGTPKSLRWPVFVKLDAGYARAGLPTTNRARLRALVARCEASPAIVLIGLYTHSGHSYDAVGEAPAASGAPRSRGSGLEGGGADGSGTAAEKVRATTVEDILRHEVGTLLDVANEMAAGCELRDRQDTMVLSFGATPQAHAIIIAAEAAAQHGGDWGREWRDRLPPGWRLELHAGNFIAKDLQQVSTQLCGLESQAMRILAEVCSVYESSCDRNTHDRNDSGGLTGRNEVLINAGKLALSGEMSPGFKGYGIVAGAISVIGEEKVDNEGDTLRRRKMQQQWYVKKMSQEHGILAALQNKEDGDTPSGNITNRAEEVWRTGDKVLLYVNHSCITAAMHEAYYVVDDKDIVREVWKPWRGW